MSTKLSLVFKHGHLYSRSHAPRKDLREVCVCICSLVWLKQVVLFQEQPIVLWTTLFAKELRVEAMETVRKQVNTRRTTIQCCCIHHGVSKNRWMIKVSDEGFISQVSPRAVGTDYRIINRGRGEKQKNPWDDVKPVHSWGGGGGGNQINPKRKLKNPPRPPPPLARQNLSS